MKTVTWVRRRLDTPTLLTIMPILFLAGLIVVYAVNTPLLDQWELVPVFKHLRGGHIFWDDFWHQHNEHRILIPNIILIASGMLTHWNLIVECILSLLVAIISFVGLLKLMRSVASPMRRNIPIALPILLSVIWFSAVQMENWLWGWQLEWFLNVLGVIVITNALVGMSHKNLSSSRIVLLIGGGLLAQYSLGNGTLVWPLLLAALLYRRVTAAKSIVIITSGIIASYFYYTNYVTPSYPSKTLFLHEPLNFIRYTLIYLGRSLTFLRTGAVVIGAGLLLTFICLNIYLLLKQRRKFDKLLPILFLGWYAIGSAGITAISRMGFGISQAYSSRYTTISMLLLISTIISVSFMAKELTSYLKGKWSTYLPAVVSLGVILLVVTNAAWGIHAAAGHHRQMKDLQQCTQQPSVPRVCLLATYPPSETIVRGRLDYLKQIHWGGY